MPAEMGVALDLMRIEGICKMLLIQSHSGGAI